MRHHKEDYQEIFIDPINYSKHGTRIAVLYPNTYYLGMSNLGFQGIFYHLLQSNIFRVSRFFYEPQNPYKTSSPENHFSLKQASIIFISLSFETDYINLIDILLVNGIEPQKIKRSYPLIGIGGAFPTMNPSFFSGIADLVFLGEYEDYLDKIIDFCSGIHQNKIQDNLILKQKALDIFSNHIYDKSTIDNANSKMAYPSLNQPSYTHILTNNTSFSNTFLIEITRGCTFRCRFCTVPTLYGKLRSFDMDKLLPVIDKGLLKTNKIGLVSALTTEYPELAYLVRYINNHGGLVTFSSLRLEQINDELLELIHINKQNILTIAPEVASQKLKRKIRKPIRIEKIFSLLHRAIPMGFKKIKFYFMIGFPEEDQQDLDDIISLMREVKFVLNTYAPQLKYMPELILSINQFIPKSMIPLSEEPFMDKKSFLDRLNYLKKQLILLGNIKINTDDYTENYLQWRISQGTDELALEMIPLIQNNPSFKSIYRNLERNSKHLIIQ